MSKLTVLIPCKDERHNLAQCVESVRELADEILIADSGSTDGTLDLARQLEGCKLIEREFISYADFKNWAIPQAANEWVLIVDADERVTPELAKEIRSVLQNPLISDAYDVKRENYFLGQQIRHCGWNNSYVRRLFRKSVCRYRICRVHEELEVDTGKVSRLSAKLLHFTCVDFDAFVRKQLKYSLFAAEDRYEKGKRIGYLTVLLHAPLRFWQLYLLRGGILDGFAGLVLCSIMAYYTFMKDAKLWALHGEAADGETPVLSAKRWQAGDSMDRIRSAITVHATRLRLPFGRRLRSRPVTPASSE
jgi:(heptosyl)LPS beta-1,4-glucosyltransferase